MYQSSVTQPECQRLYLSGMTGMCFADLFESRVILHQEKSGKLYNFQTKRSCNAQSTFNTVIQKHGHEQMFFRREIYLKELFRHFLVWALVYSKAKHPKTEILSIWRDFYSSTAIPGTDNNTWLEKTSVITCTVSIERNIPKDVWNAYGEPNKKLPVKCKC